MRVWIINPFDNLPLEGFRPQRYWLMAQAFADAGHDVTFFTSDFNHTTKQKRDLAAKNAENAKIDFKVELIPTRPYHSNVSLARILSHRAFIRTLRSTVHLHLFSPPDVIITSLPLIGSANVALELKDKYGTKVVVDIQDDWPGTFYRLFPRILRPLAKLALSPLRRAAERAYREADLVTGVADRYADLALSAGARKYLRFYHGISCAAEFQSSLRDLRARSVSSCPPKAVLYLGNLGRTYDLRTAVEAVALDSHLTLDIAGTGEQEDSLKTFAVEKGVADRVRFHGYLDEADLSELASRCAYGLIPMSEESCVGIPNKLADYARYGLFVLSSLRGESAALLSKYTCGSLYTAGDPRTLLSAIENSTAQPSIFNFQPLLSEFDATRIYRSYVAEVSKL